MKPAFIIVLFLTYCMVLLPGCHEHSIRDIDGNLYETVKIGKQIWLTSDLKVTHLNDGTPIPEVKTYEAWAVLTTPGFCWYNNDSENKKDYGALYNWFAVYTGKLCPTGWHVSTETDWDFLVQYFGGILTAGGFLKEPGTSHWKSPNAVHTQNSHFTALPSGFRSFNGSFTYLGKTGYWWTSDGIINDKVSNFQISYKSVEMAFVLAEKTNGFSVRCVKDL
jgi:uncharacterized protein (TIGR02145 family)